MTEEKCEHEWLVVSESSYTTVPMFGPGTATYPPVTTTARTYKCTKCGKVFQ